MPPPAFCCVCRIIHFEVGITIPKKAQSSTKVAQRDGPFVLFLFDNGIEALLFKVFEVLLHGVKLIGAMAFPG